MIFFKPGQALVLIFLLPTMAQADDSKILIGSWCFYEQTAAGNTVLEKVDITFNENSTYVWKEGIFEQKGSWNIKQKNLIMSDIGSHKIIGLTQKDMELKRLSIMKFKKNTCDSYTFSDQDITRFHNAASRGEDQVLANFLQRGIDINITDLNRGDTALIKSSKFCKVSITKILINKGADKAIINERGKNALDYAKNSSFHEGCQELVGMLR